MGKICTYKICPFNSQSIKMQHFGREGNQTTPRRRSSKLMIHNTLFRGTSLACLKTQAAVVPLLNLSLCCKLWIETEEMNLTTEES
jgi:hypothetical protein